MRMLGWRGGRLHPVRGDGVEGRLGAAGVWRQRWCGGGIGTAALTGGRFRTRFCAVPSRSRLWKKRRPHPLGNAVFYMKQGDGCGTVRIPHRGVPHPVQFCCRPCFATPPGYCGALFRVQPQRSFWGGLLSEWNGYSAREGRDGDTTPRRPRFGALSTPCGALFRKGRGEAPAGARR